MKGRKCFEKKAYILVVFGSGDGACRFRNLRILQRKSVPAGA